MPHGRIDDCVHGWALVGRLEKHAEVNDGAGEHVAAETQALWDPQITERTGNKGGFRVNNNRPVICGSESPNLVIANSSSVTLTAG